MLRPAVFGFAALFAACSSTSTAEAPSVLADAAADAEPSDASVDATLPTPPPDPLLPGCTLDPGPGTVTVDAASKTDPTGGAAKFTLTQALAGFPAAPGNLTALIRTELGAIRCQLAEAVAPVSVANFVGLARGTRPYKAGTWKVGRFYDGLVWHRVLPDFVIQGGDPLGKGTGGPGYDLIDENHVDEPLGTLAMAAAAKPSGSQFYVVVGTGPAADYNVFGTCTTDVAIAIANVPRDAVDHPITPVHIQRIDIARCPETIAPGDAGRVDAGPVDGGPVDAGPG
jgi:peptidyl-prolyl cis-trans isomerase A (cyclophilin A)